MNTDRLEALLWARVDGAITAEELEELETHLANHPEARAIERQISAIDEDLDSLEKVPPPSQLRARIDRALADAASPAIQRDHTSSASLAKWLPLAACLIIGVAIGYLMHPNAGGSIDRSVATGTMVAPEGELETGQIEIRLDDGGGFIIASRDRGNIEVEVTLTAEIDIAVTLGSAAGPVRLSSLISSNASATEVTPHNESVEVRAVGPGTARISVIAIDAAEPLRLQVSSGGFPVDEHWIGARREDHP